MRLIVFTVLSSPNVWGSRDYEDARTPACAMPPVKKTVHISSRSNKSKASKEKSHSLSAKEGRFSEKSLMSAPEAVAVHITEVKVVPEVSVAGLHAPVAGGEVKAPQSAQINVLPSESVSAASQDTHVVGVLPAAETGVSVVDRAPVTQLSHQPVPTAGVVAASNRETQRTPWEMLLAYPEFAQ